MSQENVEIVRSFVAAGRGDLVTALAVLDDEVEWCDQAAIPGADVHRGRDAVRRHFEQWFDAWEEIDYTIEEHLDCGDRVIVVVRRRGKGKGSAEVADQDELVHTYAQKSYSQAASLPTGPRRADRNDLHPANVIC